MAVKIIWLKRVRGRNGVEIKRHSGTLIAASEEYCTVEIDGERFAAKTEDVRLAKTANAG